MLWGRFKVGLARVRTPGAVAFAALLTAAGMLPENVYARPPRTIAIGAGFGVPYLITVDAAVLGWPCVQIGFAYGLLPGVPPLSLTVPPQSITLGDGAAYTFSPTASFSLDMLDPLIRYFPTDRNFYIELSAVFMQLNIPFTSDMTQVLTQILIKDAVSGTITSYQPLPTLSLGHLFSGKLFWCNLRLGFTFFLGALTSVNMGLTNPDLFGGAAANAPAIEAASVAIQADFNTALGTVTKQYLLLPSLAFTFGLYL